jgi:hypothetical protein
MISKWFLITILLIVLSIVITILVRIEGRKEIKRLEEGNLSTDDFDIIE